MQALEAKVQVREQEKRQAAAAAAQEAADREAQRKSAVDKNKNFLDNLEAFNVD